MKRTFFMRTLLCALVLSLVIAALPSAMAAPSQQWRAAMAKADITPKEACYLVGYYDNSAESFWEPGDPATDLAARILILDNGADGQRLVFLNLEMIASDAEYFTLQISGKLLNEIKTACHLRSTEDIILSNTHDHQAPYRLTNKKDPTTLSEYEQNILTACTEAYAELQPVKVGVTTYETDYGISRGDNYTSYDQYPYDAQTVVMRFDTMSGEPIGLIYDAPIHNTALSVIEKENAHYLSCELCGYASRYLEEQLGGTAMFINGFYGNAGPNLRGTHGIWQTGQDGVDALAYWGEELAKEVLAAYNTIEASAKSGSLTSNLYFDSLPNNMNNVSYGDAVGASNIWMQTKIAVLGDSVAFVGVDFEPFSILGAKLRAESPYETLLLAGNVNGLRGYIPTDTAFSYGNWAECGDNKTPFAPGIADIFYQKVIGQLCDMAGKTISRTDSVMTSQRSSYTFTFENPVAADKLVLDFGEEYRTNCASDFTLSLYAQDGTLLETKQVHDFSANLFGYFVQTKKPVKFAVMTAESRYVNYYQTTTKGLSSIDVSMYAVNFTDIDDLGTTDHLAAQWQHITDTKSGKLTASVKMDTGLKATKFLLHSSWQSDNYTPSCKHDVSVYGDATGCFHQRLLNNLHVVVNDGEDYGSVFFTRDKRNWSQECVYMTFKPSEKALQDAAAAPNRKVEISGYFYYETQDGVHGSTTDYPFTLTLQADENLLTDGKTGKLFNSLSDAFSQQNSFTLDGDYSADADIFISPDCTLDLNGHVLDLGAHTLTNAGKLVDSADGVGLVKLSQQTGIAFTNSGMLPIYDETAGGYRLFDYTLKTKKSDEELTTDRLHIAFALKLIGENRMTGYRLLAGGCRNKIGARVNWTFRDESQEQSRSFFFEEGYLSDFSSRMQSMQEGMTAVFHITVESSKVKPGMEARAELVSTYANGNCNGFDLLGALRTNVEKQLDGELGVDVEEE